MRLPVFLSFLTIFCAAGPLTAGVAEEAPPIDGTVVLEDGVLGGAAPSEALLSALYQTGFKAVVDLRTPQQAGRGYETLVRSNGLNFYAIPVTEENLSWDQAEALHRVLDSPFDRPVYVHCSSGNRVGALWALYRARYEGKGAREALDEGLQKGLRSATLKSKVKELLRNGEAPPAKDTA